MKSLSVALKAHYAQPLTTLVTCWKVTLKDQTVLGFTNHTRNLTYLGVTYLCASGYVPSAVESDSSMGVDNLEVEAILSDDTISEADLLAGKWDHAAIEIFEINYMDTSMGINLLRKGHLGEVSLRGVSFVAEIRGLLQAFSQNIGEIYSVNCRAVLGDSRCKINLATYTVSGTVTSATGSRIFADTSRTEADDHFNGGLVTWTSGLNNTYTMEVKDWVLASKSVELQLDMPYPIQVGDTYTLSRGCDKSKATCKNTFSNVINFRGEPDLPGLDSVLVSGG